MEAESGILSVDPEIQSEVVSRTRCNAYERDIVFDGDGGDESLGAVPSGHTKAIGSTCDGVVCQLLQVETMIEHHHLDAEVLG